MDRQAFLRQLQLFTLTGAAAMFPLVVNAQQPISRNSSQIQVQGSEPISNPVPQGYGRVNPREPSVGQGGGQYGDPRVRTGGRVDQHNGIDLPAPVGSPVLAPVSGLVVRPTNPGRDGYGDQVRIVDADGRLYILGHLSSTNVQPGAYVNAGQQVGAIGRSGNSPQNGASHVHLEVRDPNNQSIRLNSTPATDPAGAAAGFENYRDSLPSSRPSQAPQMRTPTPPQPRQAQPLSMLDRLLDFIIPSAAASTLSDPLNAGNSNGMDADLRSNETAARPSGTFDSSPDANIPAEALDNSQGNYDVDLNRSSLNDRTDQQTWSHAQTENSFDTQPNVSTQPQGGSTSNGASLNSNAGTPAPRVTVVFDDMNREQTSTTSNGNQSAANRPLETQSAISNTGMTQEEFRTTLDRQMQQFQAEAARQEAALRVRQSVPATTPVNNPIQSNRTPAPVGNSPAQPPRTTTNQYAPRNGYDENGNRADSTRRQYDAQGYYANPSTGSSQASQENFLLNNSSQSNEQQPVRQNRVYSTDGSSRPIGRNDSVAQQFQAIQQQSQQQIAQIQARRQTNSSNYDSSSPANSEPITVRPAVAPPQTPVNRPSDNRASNPNSATGSTGQSGSYRPTQTIIFDENAPRGRNATNSPSVTPRTSGTQVNTANMGPAVSVRSTGVQPQTASLQMP